MPYIGTSQFLKQMVRAPCISGEIYSTTGLQVRAVCSRTHLTLSLAVAAAEQLPKIKQAMSSGLSLSENITIKILRLLR